MKKVILIALVLSFNAVYAQQGLHIGANIGVNTTWISHQEDYDLLGVNHVLDYGISPGVNVGYNFTDNLGVQLGILYSMQGGKYQETIKDSTLNRQVKLGYLKIPIMVLYTTPIQDKIKFYIMVGPQMALLQSANITANFSDAITGDVKNRFESFDFEVAGEAGVNIFFNESLYLSVGIRGDYGLMDMNAPTYRLFNYTPLRTYTKGQNATGGLNVGINYFFGGK